MKRGEKKDRNKNDKTGQKVNRKWRQILNTIF